MWYRLGADLVLVLHLAFVLFVVAGGLLVMKWPALIWLHVPAVAWGAFIEYAGWICPLTPLENELRALAGAATYHADFVEHYLHPPYPADTWNDRDRRQCRGLWLVLAAKAAEQSAVGLFMTPSPTRCRTEIKPLVTPSSRPEPNALLSIRLE